MKSKVYGPVLAAYLSELYVSPAVQTTCSTANNTSYATPIDEVDGLPARKKPLLVRFEEDVKREVTDKLANEVSSLQQRILYLENENKQLVNSVVELKQDNVVLKAQLKAISPVRLNQTLHRKDESIKLWKKKFFDLQRKTHKSTRLDLKLRQAKETIASCKKVRRGQFQETRRCRNSKMHLRETVSNKMDHSHDEIRQSLVAKQNELKMTKEKLSFLDHQHETMKDELRNVKEGNIIESKKDGKTFSHRIREASFNLQNFGVAQRNVSGAIQCVYKSLTDEKIVGSLPSYSSQNSFVKEMKALSRQQVKETLQNADNTTVKYDGTSKPLGHMVEVEVGTSDATMLLGLTLQTGGTAAEYAKTITKTFHRIEETSAMEHDNGESTSILSQVKNTMSDRCITNKALDDKLEQIKGGKLNRFKCAMHPLDSIAKECEKSVQRFEEKVGINAKKSSGNYPFIHHGESNSQAVIRTTSKLFHDTKFNCSTELSSYLRSKGAVPREDANKTILYYRFVGNRFHILFLSSACLFHYRTAIVEFFTDVFPPQNAVHTSVFNALQLSDMKITLRALGIIGKVITGPWMRLLSKATNILEMNEHFSYAHGQITRWSNDASPLLSVDAPCAFREVDIKRDEVFDSLVKSNSDDVDTKVLLQDPCTSCLSVMNRQLQSQLPGGEYWNPSPELLLEAASCSSANISGERNFGMADNEMYRARRGKTGYIEGKVMYRVNKTGPWFEDRSNSEKEERTKLARIESRKIAQQDVADGKEHRDAVMAKLLASRAKVLQKEDRDRTKYENWLEETYCRGGLWTDSLMMNGSLKGLSKTKTVNALKAQLQVRMKVLRCEPQTKVILGKCSVEELQGLMAETMSIAVPEELDDLYELMLDPRRMVGSSFSQRWNQDDTMKWYSGQIVSCDVTTKGLLDFKVTYNDNSICYMAPEEIIVDILRGDLELFSN